MPGTELTPSCDPRVWGGGRKRPAWRRLRGNVGNVGNVGNGFLNFQIDGIGSSLWRKIGSFAKRVKALPI